MRSSKVYTLELDERAHANAADRFVRFMKKDLPISYSFQEEAGKVRRAKESGIVTANANAKQPE
jgi:hypothetical protein